MNKLDIILAYLSSEKSLFLSAGIIGSVSLVAGLLFLMFSNHKSFAITMIVLGILEMAVMFPTYIKYQQKIDTKIATYESGIPAFTKAEIINTEKALKSFFRLKLTYGILIVLLILTMSFLNSKSVLFGVFTALILHLSFAITIDNFGEKYTNKYLIELLKN
ncbi:hypothetical protein [Winogradskyella ludwigii]|uniref:hypothetical protein n=1 Tax=Winogradskyella ludwigii TaxID=2686076 RepID=UPI0015CAF01E|nr:hypothetical protein [Winogradskyella ludwigii]